MRHESVLCVLQEDLSQKRVALSMLLMDLLSQQAERRQQLLNTLTEMEKRRWVDEEVGDYFLKKLVVMCCEGALVVAFHGVEVPWP
jgi:predicted lipid carrier protein YhbT